MEVAAADERERLADDPPVVIRVRATVNDHGALRRVEMEVLRRAAAEVDLRIRADHVNFEPRRVRRVGIVEDPASVDFETSHDVQLDIAGDLYGRRLIARRVTYQDARIGCAGAGWNPRGGK